MRIRRKNGTKKRGINKAAKNVQGKKRVLKTKMSTKQNKNNKTKTEKAQSTFPDNTIDIRTRKPKTKILKRRRSSKITRKMQGKLVLLFVLIALALFGLNIRLTYINNKSGQEYTMTVLSQQRYESKTIPYQRGDIKDRNGIVLATSEKVYNLILDPKIMNSDEGRYLNTTLTALNGSFGYDIGELSSIISQNPDSSYFVYKKGLTYDEIETFKNLQSGNMKEQPEWFPKEEFSISNIQGVWFEEEYKRIYPYETLACDLLGFTNSGNVGNWGIEQYYNEELNGTDGRTYGYLNADSALERVVKPATDGNSIVTTIDINLQKKVEKHIQQYMDTVGAKNVAVMLMDPNNGEILAEASAPFFDLNNPRDLTAYFAPEQLEAMSDEESSNFLYSLWKNFCISEVYEPGSTAKPFTVATGLEEGNLLGNETFLCEGYLRVGGWDIHCHNRYGDGIVTLEESIKYSCNVAMMRIGLDIGADTFLKYQKIFNFGFKSGVDLPGEEVGLCKNIDTMDPASLVTNAFGQNFNITMTQMAAAFSSLINGGYYYQPHVMKKIVDSSGGTIKNADALLMKETVTRETSNLLREYLYHTVEEGTGIKAKVEGYTIGGKTGTAEKQPRDEGRYLVSFIGFVPVEDPQLVIYTVIDEPQLEKQSDAGQTTQLAHDILADILPYMEIFPSLPIESEITPEETTQETESSEEGKEEETTIPRATPVYNEIYEDEGSFMQPAAGEETTAAAE